MTEGLFPKNTTDNVEIYASEYNNISEILYQFNIYPHLINSLGDLVYSGNTTLTDGIYYCDSLTVNSGVTLTADTTAKLILFVVRGDVNIEGTITSVGKGLAGGVGKSAGSGGDGAIGTTGYISVISPASTGGAGGGGGTYTAYGGAGGGGIGNGGIGGNNATAGLSSYNITGKLNKLYGMGLNLPIYNGGGGGGGTAPNGSKPKGGDGGGSACPIIITATGNITISGIINASGEDGGNGGANASGGGGGGAGSSIILKSNLNMDLTGSSILAKGGNGGAGGSVGGTSGSSGSGGGAGGFVGIYCKGSYIAPTTIDVSGGTAGSGSGGVGTATAGSNGFTYINGV